MFQFHSLKSIHVLVHILVFNVSVQVLFIIKIPKFLYQNSECKMYISLQITAKLSLIKTLVVS